MLVGRRNARDPRSLGASNPHVDPQTFSVDRCRNRVGAGADEGRVDGGSWLSRCAGIPDVEKGAGHEVEGLLTSADDEDPISRTSSDAARREVRRWLPVALGIPSVRHIRRLAEPGDARRAWPSASRAYGERDPARETIVKRTDRLGARVEMCVHHIAKRAAPSFDPPRSMESRRRSASRPRRLKNPFGQIVPDIRAGSHTAPQIPPRPRAGRTRRGPSRLDNSSTRRGGDPVGCLSNWSSHNGRVRLRTNAQRTG